MLTEEDFSRHGAPDMGSFFAEAVPTQAYAKVGLLGGQGAGKTMTAVKIAIGLHAELKARGLREGSRPIAFLESSEFGLDFHIRTIESATGMKPLHRKTKAFKDLTDAMRIAARDGMILVVDTISGYAEELQNAYRDTVGRESLTVEDLGNIGRQWAEAMEAFKDEPFHGILCGRVAYEWGFFENETTGRRELERTDLKMKGIGDVGYECSLLVALKKQTDLSDATSPRVFRVATVLKDKAQLVDGVSFNDPGYAEFAPHFQALALGGTHRPAAAESSVSIIRDPRTGKASWEEKTAVVDEIETLLAHFLPGQDAESKRKRGDALNRNFGTLSKERLRFLHLDALRRGYNVLHRELTGYDPVIPTRSPNWTPPVINPPADVAMMRGPDGKMYTVADYNVKFQNLPSRIRAVEAAEAAASGNAPPAPLPAPGEGSPVPPAPDVTPGPPVKRKGGRPKKNSPAAPGELFAGDKPAEPTPAAPPANVPTEPAPAEAAPAPDAPPAPAAPPPDVKDPAPPIGGTNPTEVLATVTAPAEPAKRRGRPPGSKNRAKADEPAGLPSTVGAMEVAADNAGNGDGTAAGEASAPKRRGRPPGSRNRPKAAGDAGDAPPVPAPGGAATGAATPLAIPAPPVPAPNPATPETDPGTWTGFSILAPKAAGVRGIDPPAFMRGLNATLSKARLLDTPKESLPREFLSDFYDAITSGTWNHLAGEFTGAPAAS